MKSLVILFAAILFAGTLLIPIEFSIAQESNETGTDSGAAEAVQLEDDVSVEASTEEMAEEEMAEEEMAEEEMAEEEMTEEEMTEEEMTEETSPRMQMESGIASLDIQCKDGYQLIFKSTDFSPACVKESSVERLLERGWAANEERMMMMEEEMTEEEMTEEEMTEEEMTEEEMTEEEMTEEEMTEEEMTEEEMTEEEMTEEEMTEEEP